MMPKKVESTRVMNAPIRQTRSGHCSITSTFLKTFPKTKFLNATSATIRAKVGFTSKIIKQYIRIEYSNVHGAIIKTETGAAFEDTNSYIETIVMWKDSNVKSVLSRATLMAASKGTWWYTEIQRNYTRTLATSARIKQTRAPTFTGTP